ncbi:hypothetical protein Pst134EA_013218 [Puccinia striiformis f. sp. tritici]|uniref:hypothetical protein n=1 Tax=Puccinia striiformis f. sp. tritici TaxID=168172 RepID=UPI0020082DAA|nr:hypothetical protein Pst134EA_013218 [Puccinia striiformis f. sp. tritici]KAH9465329.1 hypothetical protein Pst134EA_013218 [Puccinia striiformis f. sp. tritici]
MTVDQQPSSSSSPSIETFHLFWPSDSGFDSFGYLVGWKIDRVYCIATLSQNYQLDSLSHSVNRSFPNSSVRLLGQLNPHDPSPTQYGEDWITMRYDQQGTLQIKRGSNEEKMPMIIVIYDRPSIRKHHFLSLRPLLKPSLLSNQSSSSLKPSGNENLAQKIRLFDTVYPKLSAPDRDRSGHPKQMSQVIDCINKSEAVHNRLHTTTTTSTTTATTKSEKKEKEKKVEKNSASNRQSSVYKSCQNHINSIINLSTFIQQFNVRLVEISSWPDRYRKIRREEAEDLSSRRAEYVMLFNTLWLIANDIIFGRASGAILMEHSQLLADWLEFHLQTYTVTFVKKALLWTNSYPVGLKLNDQLGNAFWVGSNMAIDFWHIYVLKHAYLILPKMIWIVGFVSLFGNTFALAIASDFLTIATFHLWMIYRFFTFVFDSQLRFLSVLFNIFRGRKYNVLRNRNEPATYQLDQLILGTILFTLAIFLFPTILAFYILTSTTRVLIVWVHGIIGTGLSLLNHFPLFVVMLRLKDSARLPSGVCFIPVHDHDVAMFKLQNVPVGLTWIFSDYISLWASLTSHYSPRLLLYHLCSGKPIAPLTNRAAAYKRP